MTENEAVGSAGVSEQRKHVKRLTHPLALASSKEEQTTKAKEKLDLKILWLPGMKLFSNSIWISDFSGSQSGKKDWTVCGAHPPSSLFYPPSILWAEPRDQWASISLPASEEYCTACFSQETWRKITHSLRPREGICSSEHVLHKSLNPHTSLSLQRNNTIIKRDRRIRFVTQSSEGRSWRGFFFFF